MRLIVKAHPRDDVPALKKLCANYPRIRIVDSQVEVASLIKACDAFITMFSQTTLEALYADKPVININFPGSGVKSPFLMARRRALPKVVKTSESPLQNYPKAIMAFSKIMTIGLRKRRC